jgi:hypothetical protein
MNERKYFVGDNVRLRFSYLLYNPMYDSLRDTIKEKYGPENIKGKKYYYSVYWDEKQEEDERGFENKWYSELITVPVQN